MVRNPSSCSPSAIARNVLQSLQDNCSLYSLGPCPTVRAGRHSAKSVLGKMPLCPENEPGSDGGMNDLFRKRGAREVIKPLPATMSQNQIVGIDLLERSNDFVNVTVVERGHD